MTSSRPSPPAWSIPLPPRENQKKCCHLVSESCLPTKKWWWSGEFVKYLLSLLPNHKTLWNIHRYKGAHRREPSWQMSALELCFLFFFLSCHKSLPVQISAGASPAAFGAVNGWVPWVGICNDWRVDRGFAKTFSCSPGWFHVSSLHTFVAAQHRSRTWNPCWLAGKVWNVHTFSEFSRVTLIIHPFLKFLYLCGVSLYCFMTFSQLLHREIVNS